MPAVYDSFVAMGYQPGPAWRLTFVVPLVMVVATGLALLLLCPDTPGGTWSGRTARARESLQAHVGDSGAVVDVTGGIADRSDPPEPENGETQQQDEREKRQKGGTVRFGDHEAVLSRDEMVQTVQGEIVVEPTLGEAARVAASAQTWFLILCYACSFGAELALNGILAAYYLKNFPGLGQTGASNWAAMFGFLNFATRPLGGAVADVLYERGGRNLWWKKGWINVCGLLAGLFLITIGRVDPRDRPTMLGLTALAAFFIEAGNGANFALVPHVHPFANGIVSGLTGAGGNLGGVVFAIGVPLHG